MKKRIMAALCALILFAAIGASAYSVKPDPMPIGVMLLPRSHYEVGDHVVISIVHGEDIDIFVEGLAIEKICMLPAEGGMTALHAKVTKIPFRVTAKHSAMESSVEYPEGE